MSTSKQVLLNYLTKGNPRLNITACSKGRNTKSTKAYPWDQPTFIVKWREFEYEALLSIYGGKLRDVLGQSFELENFHVPRVPFCQIHDENSLDSLIIKWNQSMTSKALTAAQRHLKVHHSETVYFCKGGQAQWPREAEIKKRPDWAAVKGFTLARESAQEVRNVLPGDTKLSKKWSSDRINPGDLDDIEFEDDWYQPLSQIFTYCVRSNARYGYLITDKELVVVRVSPRDPLKYPWSQSSDAGKRKARKETIRRKHAAREPCDKAIIDGCLEYQTIPWDDRKRSQRVDAPRMTANLALWWLHLLAANDGAIEEDYVPLDESEWSMETETQTPTSSFSMLGDSQESQPLAESPPARRLRSFTIGSSFAGTKRSRSEEDEGDEGEDDSENDQPKSSQKRRNRKKE
ncbi:hypothetical protein ACLMJK_006381 [Lecanora helva]